MGFLNKLKSVNNSWGYVTYLSDGSLGRIFGRIGPKNMIDNRSQELVITSGTMNGPLKDEIVFAAKDVVRATVLQATNEWVKYRLELNSGLVAIVVMTVMGLDVRARDNRATMDRNFLDKWLNFEAWLGPALNCDNKKQSNALPLIETAPTQHTTKNNNSPSNYETNESKTSKSTCNQPSKLETNSKTLLSKQDNYVKPNLNFSARKMCPHCGDFITSNICDMCGKRNNLF